MAFKRHTQKDKYISVFKLEKLQKNLFTERNFYLDNLSKNMSIIMTYVRPASMKL